MPLPNKPKELPGEQQDQGHEVVHHDQGEAYQQPKTFKVAVSQGVPSGTNIPYSC